jgi:prefoldin subunit 5
MTIDVIHTQATGYAPQAGDGGDMADIAFALAAFQLDGLDADLGFRLQSMKQLMAVKNAVREKIAALQEVLKELPKSSSRTWIDGDLATRSEFAWDAAEGRVTDGGTSVFVEGNIQVCDGEDDGCLVVRGEGESMEEALARAGRIVQDNPEHYSEVWVKVDREEVETEIARLQGTLDELSGEGEIGLLAINRLLGKRSQALQLASNVMSSAHQGAMGIIANIK